MEVKKRCRPLLPAVPAAPTAPVSATLTVLSRSHCSSCCTRYHCRCHHYCHRRHIVTNSTSVSSITHGFFGLCVCINPCPSPLPYALLLCLGMNVHDSGAWGWAKKKKNFGDLLPGCGYHNLRGVFLSRRVRRRFFFLESIAFGELVAPAEEGGAVRRKVFEKPNRNLAVPE